MSEALPERTAPNNFKSFEPWMKGGVICRVPTLDELNADGYAGTRVANGSQDSENLLPEKFLDDATLSSLGSGALASEATLDYGVLEKSNSPLEGNDSLTTSDLEKTVERPYLPSVQIESSSSPRQKGEYDINGVNFRYEGSKKGRMLFKSTGRDGVSRNVVVYTSKSQGSVRVSQGYEVTPRGARLIKGPEFDQNEQYTQDTQLHPDFLDVVERVQETKELWGKEVTELPRFDEADTKSMRADFANQIDVSPLVKGELDKALHRLRAGFLGKNQLKQITGLDPYESPQAALEATDSFMGKVSELNNLLETSGVMPDFAEQPTAVARTSHPQLGEIVVETFTKSVDGVPIEWEMARNMDGSAIWIERIRRTDAEPTVYGTDDKMIYSGILTSKPMEYQAQCDAIPAHLRITQRGSSYSDITPFLSKLAPIANYARHFSSRRALYEHR